MPETNYNRGCKYLNKGNYEKALQFFKKETVEFRECYLNMGNAYKGLMQYDKALECFLKANSPYMQSFTNVGIGDYSLALNNLGLLEYARGNDNDAITFYDACSSKEPEHKDAPWNKGNALLRMGCSGVDVDWTLAWKLYGHRMSRTNPTRIDRSVPFWDGFSRVPELTILAEQGMGDKIMFGRYISLLEERVGTVYVQCPPELDVFFKNPVRKPIGVGIPFCSLAQWWAGISGGNGVFSIGANYNHSGSGIGVVWKGSTTHLNNANRSVFPGTFKSLSRFDQLVSLTPGDKTFKSYGNVSWADTLDVIRGLRMVVSVDTSVVHAAGSIGARVFMLQPKMETDWRWGNPYGEHANMWYDSVKVMNNVPGWENDLLTGVEAVYAC